MGVRRSLFVIILLPALSGCVNAEAERQKAIAAAYDRCAKQGKQPQVVDLHQEGIANVTSFHAVPDFKCLGPDDPGYVPTQAPNK